MVEVREASDLSWIEVRPDVSWPSNDLIPKPFTVQVQITRCRCADTVPSDTQMELYDGVLSRTRQAETDIRGSISVSHTFGFVEHNFVGIFHCQYRNLEEAVEGLSQQLEKPIEADTVRDLKKRMMDETVRAACHMAELRANHNSS